MTTPPTQLSSPSDYMVGVAIGEGAFGNVLYGKHKSSQTEVAIKVIPKLSVEKHPSLLYAVKQERTILTQCNESPYIISLYASFHDEQCLYLVMECATRGTLQDAIVTCCCCSNNTNGWKTQVVPYYTRCLLHALEYLHVSQNVIHADLKPPNILITETGTLQLCDFGSAIQLNSGNGGDSDKEGQASYMPRGTADYAAPELIRGDNNTITPAVDLWSLGCVVFCMLKCESPFHAESDALCIDKIIKYAKDHDCESDNVLFKDISSEYKPLLKQLLHPDPSKRGDANTLQSDCNILPNTPEDSNFLPPHPTWWNEAQSCPMRDGNQGWAVYLAE